jgi:type IV pilus assembly protein PilX
MTQQTQRGATLLIVLFLLAVMMLGGLMYMGQSFVNTQLAGNLARNEASAQAADVGIATAFEELKALVDDNANLGGWYFATRLMDDADGLPAAIDWNVARALPVGAYNVRYIVERHCRTALVTDEINDCLLSESALEIRDAGSDAPIAPPSLRTYRVTVRVNGPKHSESWAQALLSRR